MEDLWALGHADDSFGGSVLSSKGNQWLWFNDRDEVLDYLLSDYVDLLADTGELDEEQCEAARERFTDLVESCGDDQQLWKSSMSYRWICGTSSGLVPSLSWRQVMRHLHGPYAIFIGSSKGMKMILMRPYRWSSGASWWKCWMIFSSRVTTTDELTPLAWQMAVYG